MLKAAVDVFYREKKAKAVCVLFEHWQSEEVFSTHVAYSNEVADYEPGAFYKRELPCLLNVLQQINPAFLDAVLIDGYVYLDDEGKQGLGAHLYAALNEAVPVIGVAKTWFAQNSRRVLKIYRGKSQNPLFITAIGIDVNKAAAAIQSMAGGYRMPLLLRHLDRKTREDS